MASPAADDYLKTVYAHTEWQDAPITPSVLAAKLGIAPSSVTEMVKKLAAAGLVSHVPYGAVRLTEAGTARALAMVRRHRLVETWLVQEFGYGWDEVHDEAEVLEHTISDRLLEGIDARLGRPRFDPHGDAIPDADGRIEREPFVLLADAPVGHTGRVLRVDDRDPELLRALEPLGLTVASTVTVTASGVEIDGTETALPDEAAQVVWLSA
ncbi:MULTISPECIES: metal-dependent transcriptional regulator [Microbacterium]|uniref:Manganese transport regulator n=1 Tax=Microbacterium maritypicum TaxID=33918 RepID=A0A4Y4BBM0_MICMQ|nr:MULTISPECIES: metal-dependent transcriptional regulator [Microbacterium]KAB1886100.1 metal-dependent transcriptional regulator [Microbacterium liquefaciens]QYG12616.1 metal-dependent transcriptional regulator [Microbacterium sp. PAMC22086]WKT90141.1 metal-dependent transcriptional regulator [Microbacterium liquefaciens]GEC76902.1 DtxR family transcriptional regulator [Microbacterium liquefaciens]GGV65228.1 DtxR family transcriptional regulator [Microbacterium liquefaciens]